MASPIKTERSDLLDQVQACSAHIGGITGAERWRRRWDVSDALRARAEAYTRLREYGRAEVDLKEAVRLVPTSDLVHYSLGMLRWHQKRFDEALTHLQSALDLRRINEFPISEAVALRAMGLVYVALWTL